MREKGWMDKTKTFLILLKKKNQWNQKSQQFKPPHTLSCPWHARTTCKTQVMWMLHKDPSFSVSFNM